ncbi:MAG: hypothetical protein HS113_19125 [Verrucomicrobiales bacterium]|nr:hypothetical protein [Verrucomicrobiales bacterium]
MSRAQREGRRPPNLALHNPNRARSLAQQEDNCIADPQVAFGSWREDQHLTVLG